MLIINVCCVWCTVYCRSVHYADKQLVNALLGASHQAFDNWQIHVDFSKVAVNYLTKLMKKVDLIA